MAENTPAIFGKNLVDLTGLTSFWAAAKDYIDGQIDATEGLVSDLSAGQVTANMNAISAIDEKLSDAGIGANGTIGTGTIQTAITTAVNGLATGQVNTNKTNIEALRRDVDSITGGFESNVDGQIDAKLNPVIEDVNQNTQDISGISTKLSKAGIGTNGTIGTGTIQTAINTAVNGLANGQVKENTEAIDGLTETVSGHIETLTSHTNSINGIPAAIEGQINTFKAGLTHTNVGSGNYVSGVSQANGKVTVTYATLPDIDGKDEDVLNDAKKYTDDAIAAHASLATHITPTERTNWNTAATRIDTFLTSVTDNSVIDTLTEINKWFTDHKGEYGEVVESIQINTDNIASNLEKINAINTNLATITIADPQACADIVG